MKTQNPRSRTRTTLNFSRIRATLAGPWMDTRTWIDTGRISDDPAEREYDPILGWSAGVTLHSLGIESELVQIAYKVGRGTDAPTPGCLCLILIPGGDPNRSPVIIAELHAEDCPAIEVEEEIAEAKSFLREPEVFRSEEWAGFEMEAEAVRLGIITADSPVARGSEVDTALAEVVEALNEVVKALGGGLVNAAGPVTTNPAGVAAVAKISVAAGKIEGARLKVRSERVFVD